MKRIILTIVGSAFLFVIGLNISVNQNIQNKDVSLALKSVEALAGGEGSTTCYKGGGGIFSGSVPICNAGCPYVWLTHYSKSGTCYF